MNYWVRTNTSADYNFEGARFEIINGIAHFFDEDGECIWVIKDWVSFRCVSDEELESKMTPDEFYEKMDDQ